MAKLLTILVIIPSVIPSQNGPKTLTDVYTLEHPRPEKLDFGYEGYPGRYGNS